MTKKWETIDRRETTDGMFELRQRDVDDFLICIDGRVLMNSRASRSEEVLGVRACQGLAAGARVLVGGLGMGLTLRAVVDSLPEDSQVRVAELHSVIADWCRGPLGPLTDHVLDDPRVSWVVGNVSDVIREAADSRETYHAIVIDLFEGPHAHTQAGKDPLYGRGALERTFRALEPGGVFGVWAEAREEIFEARLRQQGFRVDSRRPGRGGLRHWTVFGRKPG